MTNSQSEKFLQNWSKNHALYGTKKWETDVDFLYYIMAIVPLAPAKQLIDIRQKFMDDHQVHHGFLIDADHLHITLALPGRLGTHFQKNDIKHMEKTLEHIFHDCAPLEVEIANFNVFPNTLFAEVHDSTARLQQIHEAICDEIPFSQHPEYRYQNFLPHVSVIYGGQPAKPLEANTKREFAPIKLEISEIIFGKTRDEEVGVITSFSREDVIATYNLG